jgi:transposase-like protein
MRIPIPYEQAFSTTVGVVIGESGMSSETKQRRARRNYDLGYKRKIVQEYLSGSSSGQELASREGLEVGQIYK